MGKEKGDHVRIFKFTIFLGCGKTTLLNFLSGRMVSDNLKITGKMMINGMDVPNIDVVSNQIAYVMQDDILMGTFTPRGSFNFKDFFNLYNVIEAFNFAANMRLKVSQSEKTTKVSISLKK